MKKTRFSLEVHYAYVKAHISPSGNLSMINVLGSVHKQLN